MKLETKFPSSSEEEQFSKGKGRIGRSKEGFFSGDDLHKGVIDPVAKEASTSPTLVGDVERVMKTFDIFIRDGDLSTYGTIHNWW